MPGDRIMPRRQRRRQGHDELLLIFWIIRRHASGDGLSSFVLEFQARKFRYYAFAEIQLDLHGGSFARNISCGAGGYQFWMSIGCSSKQANRQNRKGTYRVPGHSNSFPCNSNWCVGLQTFSRLEHWLPQPATNPDSRNCSRNSVAANNDSIADIREPRHESPEGHDDRHG